MYRTSVRCDQERRETDGAGTWGLCTFCSCFWEPKTALPKLGLLIFLNSVIRTLWHLHQMQSKKMPSRGGSFLLRLPRPLSAAGLHARSFCLAPCTSEPCQLGEDTCVNLSEQHLRSCRPLPLMLRVSENLGDPQGGTPPSAGLERSSLAKLILLGVTENRKQGEASPLHLPRRLRPPSRHWGDGLPRPHMRTSGRRALPPGPRSNPTLVQHVCQPRMARLGQAPDPRLLCSDSVTPRVSISAAAFHFSRTYGRLPARQFCMEPLLRPPLGRQASWSRLVFPFGNSSSQGQMFSGPQTLPKFCLVVLTWHPAPSCCLREEGNGKIQAVGGRGAEEGRGQGRGRSCRSGQTPSSPDVRPPPPQPAETRWSRVLPPAGPGLCVLQQHKLEPLPFRTC